MQQHSFEILCRGRVVTRDTNFAVNSRHSATVLPSVVGVGFFVNYPTGLCGNILCQVNLVFAPSI